MSTPLYLQMRAALDRMQTTTGHEHERAVQELGRLIAQARAERAKE